MTSKGGRPPSGQVKWLRSTKSQRFCWHARFTINGKRTKFAQIDSPFDPKIAEGDRAGALQAARAAYDFLVNGGAVDSRIAETVTEYAKRWVDDRVGRVYSVDDDRARMRLHVLPTLGPLDARAFTRDDVERLRDELDAKILRGDLAWKTATSVWTLVTSMCSDMVNAKKRELRVRNENPCRDVEAPERGARKSKQYLYPSEVLKFLACEDVPLDLRRAVAISVYLFVRDELRALRWDEGDVDLEHGTLSITRSLARTGSIKPTKSGETRRFAVEPNLLPLLQAMHESADGKGTVVSFRDRHMSRDLRLWLKRAGITRPELHQGTATRKPMTWHDLRATGLTWLAVRGDDPLKIMQRAGHADFETTKVYLREAENLAYGFGMPFPRLPEGLLLNRPEIAPSDSEDDNVAILLHNVVEAPGIEPGSEKGSLALLRT
jgi:integrase